MSADQLPDRSEPRRVTDLRAADAAEVERLDALRAEGKVATLAEVFAADQKAWDDLEAALEREKVISRGYQSRVDDLLAENEALKANTVDRPHIRKMIAAALAGEEYSVVEMAHDLQHALGVNDRLDVERERLCEALAEIVDDLGGNKHIRWAPNYPEVDHAIQVAQMALEGSGASDEQEATP